ncbi:MAG: repair protein RecO [Bacteroidota bacterium]|jgi:DNA repair protein RecO (recombination protein O)|nr:repair protein RecO [Bacteroidota bacterium]
MLQKTSGIVLHTTKYSESSLIVKLYTRDHGLQSCIINGVRSKRSKNKASLFQPLALVDVVLFINEKPGLQRISEIGIQQQYTSLPFDIIKSSIALFLNEVLSRSLKEAHQDEELFEFIKSSLLILDLTTENPSNFHLGFMLQLSRFLGFSPQGEFSEKNPVFDLQEGKFMSLLPQHPHYITSMRSRLLSELLRTDYESLSSVRLDRTERKQLLHAIVLYFQLHINGFGSVRSLEVLEEVIS